MLPRTRSVFKNTSTHNWSKDDSRGQKAGPDQIHTKKAAIVLPESENKYFDIAEQVDYNEGLNDDSDYMSLSSDNNRSSTLFSSDDSEDIWEFDCLVLSLQDQFSLSLSLSESWDVLLDKDKDFPVFDGSRMSPASDTPIILNRPCEDTEVKVLDDKLVFQLHESVRNKVKHSQTGHSASGDSSYGLSLCENSLVANCHASFATNNDTTSRDFDGTDIWVSSLDLEGEDSELIQGGEQVSDILDSDFPSPSFRAKQNIHISSLRSSIGQTDDIKNAIEEYDFDEPLFWPFDHDSYGCSEIRNFLCLSPDKHGGIGDVSGPHRELKSIRSRQHQENTPAGRQQSQGCRRRITFSTTPKSAAAECKSRGSDNVVHKTAASTSWSSKATESSSDRNPGNTSKKRRPPQLKNDPLKHADGQLKEDHLQGCGRRIAFSPKSAAAKSKTGGADNGVQKTAASPSRSSKTTKASSDRRPGNMPKKRRPPQLKNDVPKHASCKEILQEFEADNLRELVMEGVPVEKFVGLNEFDGHEGINKEFELDQFSLCITLKAY